MFCVLKNKRVSSGFVSWILIPLNYDLLCTRNSNRQNEAISGVVIAVTRVKLCLSELAGLLCRIGLWTMALSSKVLLSVTPLIQILECFLSFYINIYQPWVLKACLYPVTSVFYRLRTNFNQWFSNIVQCLWNIVYTFIYIWRCNNSNLWNIYSSRTKMEIVIH